MENDFLKSWLNSYADSNPSKLGYIISWLGKDYWLVNHENGYVSDFHRRYTIREFFNYYGISTWAEIRVARTGDQKHSANYK